MPSEGPQPPLGPTCPESTAVGTTPLHCVTQPHAARSTHLVERRQRLLQLWPLGVGLPDRLLPAGHQVTHANPLSVTVLHQGWPVLRAPDARQLLTTP